MESGRKSPPSSRLSSAAPLHVSEPVKNNARYRYLTLLAVKILERFRPRHGNVLMLTKKLCVKYGRRVDLSEASTMISGEIIGSGWLKRSEQSKATLLAQLAKMVTETRELRPPEGVGIASVDGGSLYDCRVPGQTMRFGPFRAAQEFHRHLRRGMEFDPRLDAEVQDLVKQQDGSWPLVFTHGDLSSLNILVRGEDIVGLIDWETAGWYPSYWEYTCAYQVNPQNTFWVNGIDKFLQPMPDELAMEQLRQKYFGDV